MAIGSAVDVGRGEAWATALMVSATVVLLGLVLVLALLLQSRRDRSLDVIIEGRETEPIAVVQRERNRLRAPRTRRRVAHTTETMISMAMKPPISCVPSARPLFNVAVVASAADDLRVICRLLRADHASARGVALVERLISDTTSPFYGNEAGLLREELHRIQRALGD
jgi:hypothetical protein